ncbi:MAG: hypothetical protein IEMM0006_1588 [bacterium]|nr:MAG: hypothetical protein IEMM0006_1588 [bacterium]
MNKAEIVIYKDLSNADFQIEVRVEEDMVWLSRQQLSVLFDRDVKTIGKHIANALKEELRGFSVVAKFATTAADGKTYQVEHYNLDMIVSIGYRVKSGRGIQFRIWANKVLKEYLLNRHIVDHRIGRVENKINQLENRIDNVEFKIQAGLPPQEGIFFDGQIFDAWQFVSGLIKEAGKNIIFNSPVTFSNNLKISLLTNKAQNSQFT